MSRVVVAGSFDNLASRHLRLLQEAAAWGRVHVWLWSDQAVEQMCGAPPKFPQQERRYLLEAVRSVAAVGICEAPGRDGPAPMPPVERGDVWVLEAADDNELCRQWCRRHGVEQRVVADDLLTVFPDEFSGEPSASTTRPKALVTGCYDWFHSGHVRFFEEVSQLGELYVVVGHDDNIALLKGAGHPMFPAAERRYMVSTIKFVHQALISSGDGWLDAEPEIERIRPDLYVVNEDGDRPEKRDYCAQHGITYRVLQRRPKPGLPARESTKLRGF